jgi:hypothetical protein
MKKLNCFVCDNPACRKVCPALFPIIQGKKRKLHFCSDECASKHRKKKGSESKPMSEEEYLEKCKELLDYFRKDYSKDIIMINSGDLSCIMNPESKFYELFGGHSIWGVAEFVAKKMNKQIKFEPEDY